MTGWRLRQLRRAAKGETSAGSSGSGRGGHDSRFPTIAARRALASWRRSCSERPSKNWGGRARARGPPPPSPSPAASGSSIQLCTKSAKQLSPSTRGWRLRPLLSRAAVQSSASSPCQCSRQASGVDLGRGRWAGGALATGAPPARGMPLVERRCLWGAHAGGVGCWATGTSSSLHVLPDTSEKPESQSRACSLETPTATALSPVTTLSSSPSSTQQMGSSSRASEALSRCLSHTPGQGLAGGRRGPGIGGEPDCRPHSCGEREGRGRRGSSCHPCLLLGPNKAQEGWVGLRAWAARLQVGTGQAWRLWHTNLVWLPSADLVAVRQAAARRAGQVGTRHRAGARVAGLHGEVGPAQGWGHPVPLEGFGSPKRSLSEKDRSLAGRAGQPGLGASLAAPALQPLATPAAPYPSAARQRGQLGGCYVMPRQLPTVRTPTRDLGPGRHAARSPPWRAGSDPTRASSGWTGRAPHAPSRAAAAQLTSSRRSGPRTRPGRPLCMPAPLRCRPGPADLCAPRAPAAATAAPTSGGRAPPPAPPPRAGRGCSGPAPRAGGGPTRRPAPPARAVDGRAAAGRPRVPRDPRPPCGCGSRPRRGLQVPRPRPCGAERPHASASAPAPASAVLGRDLRRGAARPSAPGVRAARRGRPLVGSARRQPLSLCRHRAHGGECRAGRSEAAA